MRTYKEILNDVSSSCNSAFYTGYKNIESSIVEAAAKIYIAELQLDYSREIDKAREQRPRIKYSPEEISVFI